MLLLAYTVGAVAKHALFVQMHECTHNLIFKKRVLNTLAGCLANIPSVFPASVSFQRYHLKHHAYQGVYELDADIPSEWEAKWVGNSSIRKAIWLALFPIFATFHTLRIKEVQVFDRWILLNWAIVVGADILIVLTLGWTALLYLLASMFFAAGLHPLGARWIQRHYLMGSPQETYSYYGALNRVAFNVGYHNEHHDFPSVPWHRLPRLKAAASEWYDGLEAHHLTSAPRGPRGREDRQSWKRRVENGWRSVSRKTRRAGRSRGAVLAPSRQLALPVLLATRLGGLLL